MLCHITKPKEKSTQNKILQFNQRKLHNLSRLWLVDILAKTGQIDSPIPSFISFFLVFYKLKSLKNVFFFSPKFNAQSKIRQQSLWLKAYSGITMSANHHIIGSLSLRMSLVKNSTSSHNPHRESHLQMSKDPPNSFSEKDDPSTLKNGSWWTN